jgi:hypothetical protein
MLNVKFHDDHFGIKEFVSNQERESQFLFIECCYVIEVVINNMDLVKVVIIIKTFRQIWL